MNIDLEQFCGFLLYDVCEEKLFYFFWRAFSFATLSQFYQNKSLQLVGHIT